MQNSYPASILKAQNKKAILQHIYQEKIVIGSTLPDAMGLSRPTVTKIIKELCDENLISLSGLAESTGGRKANKYTFRQDTAIAIGVEITATYFDVVATDLYGQLLKFEKINLAYENKDEYYDHVCEIIGFFIKPYVMMNKTILGVGIALQALVSPKGDQILYGKILDCADLNVSTFSTRLGVPCRFHHDAEVCANVELWSNPGLKHAVFFNIRDDVSGAVIIDGKFFEGLGLKSGVFEHMTLVPNGRLCYCGKRGCLNTYCSISSLLQPDENLEVFFRNLRLNKPKQVGQWKKYLNYLALAIDNLHMVISCRVILGGVLARHLIDEDIEQLQSLVHERTAFPESRPFIVVSQWCNQPAAVGAAIPYIRQYLNAVMDFEAKKAK